MKKNTLMSVKSCAYSCYSCQPVKGHVLIDVNYYDTQGKKGVRN